MNNNAAEPPASELTGFEIAVIGMSGRFPGSDNIEEFWDNLKNGREGIIFFSAEELREAGVPDQLLNNPEYVKGYGWLEEIFCFDAEFFGYTPLEAEIMNPQLRLFHQCAYEALEEAGYAGSGHRKKIGIFAGASGNFDWQARVELSGKAKVFGWFAAIQLTDKDFLGTRVAYKLGLKGPAVTVDTACSTSLTAIHLACQGLIAGDCDMALAGGVTTPFLAPSGYLYEEGMISSKDGHCRAFDARADGCNRGNAVAIVLLKRYTDAAAEGDHVYAVIKGSAFNNDGDRKAAYSAPSIDGQSTVIRTALAMAEVHPETVSYIETHGTGTTLGDPVEIEGLKAAFNTTKKHFCRIGSVKTNVGHLERASGVTGFIKTVLALKHKQIPPSLHFENLNPKIDLTNTPFVVNTRLTEWKTLEPGQPLRAGVSSFGIGGTNTHVILEEAPIAQSVKRKAQGAISQGSGRVSPPGQSREREYQLILLSAKTAAALQQMTQNLADHFKKNPDINIADAAYTLQVGRQVYSHRAMLVCPGSYREAADLLSLKTGKYMTYKSDEDNRPIVFLFPGLGSQYVNMGRDIYEQETIFREEMNRCFEILEPLLDYEIREILYPGDSVNNASETIKVGAQSSLDNNTSPRHYKSNIHHINQPEISQIVTFIFEYALARLLIKWGIKPYAMMGYSFGEYAAACVSGVLSLTDALKLVVARGKLLQQTPEGAMLSVPLTQEELNPHITENKEISLAIDNGISCVIAGPPPALEQVAKQLKQKKIMCMPVPAARALHSHMMEPILEKFAAIFDTITLNKPQIRYISNVTGDWLTDGEALEPTYWTKHLRETVRFAKGMKTLLKEPGIIFLEVGPGRDISTLTLRYLEEDENAGKRVLNLVKAPQQDTPDLYFLLNRIGRLWLYGQPINWDVFYGEQKKLRNRVPLPTYPFEKKRYWIESVSTLEQKISSAFQSKSQQTTDFSHWFYIPTWTRAQLLPWDDKENPGSHICLVFIDQCGLGALLTGRLRQEGHEVVAVEIGTGFVEKTAGTYVINPGQPEHYTRLFRQLETRGLQPSRIFHLWGVTGTGPSGGFEQIQTRGLYSLLYIARAMGREKLAWDWDMQIDVVTDQLQEVTGEEALCPAKATMIGAVRVIPQEYPGIRCRSIDVLLPPPGTAKMETLAHQLLEEMHAAPTESIVAYRHTTRWVQAFNPLKLDKTREKHLKLRKNGVYLITGGLGNIGLMLAEYLAGKVKANLVLIGRSTIPSRQEWEQWLREHDETEAFSQKIKRLQAIENSGAEIRVFSLDTADKQKMQTLITRVENELGPINGVIHAAGITKGKSFAPIQQLEIAHCREQFQPKVNGLLILEELFREKEPDFFWLISSISVVLGGLGMTAYAAANSFMDALAQQLDRTRPGKWISVDWDGMDSEKTRISFERVLSLGKVTRLVASNGGELQERIRHWVELGFLEEKNKSVEEEKKHHNPRPDLTNPYVAPQTPIEKATAEIFQNMFGYERIGIDDDFFEIGLDSIKAIQIRLLMNKKGYDIELPDFFHHPTISQLTPFITTVQPFAVHPGSTVTGEIFRQLESRYPYPVQDIYPVTPMQEGMLFHALYETQNIQAYMEQFTFRLQGDMKVSLVEKAVNELARRHDILRTVFVHEDMDRPLQVVFKERTVDFFYKDLRPAAVRGEHEKETFIKEYIEKEKRHSFDLSKDKLMRAAVIQEEEDKYILVLTYHHILLDGWSLGIYISEFFEIYNSYVENQPYRLPPARPFRTYIDWIESKDKTGGKNFWKAYLDGYEEIASIPKKKSYQARYLAREVEYTAGRMETILDKEKTRCLQQMAARSHVTLNTVFHTVWSIVLAAYSGKLEAEQAEVVFGAVVSGRPAALEGVENIVGCFINTIPVRVCLHNRATFKQLLEEVQAKAIECEPYHYYSLAEIQNQSLLKQNLLDHFLEFQNYPTAQQIGNMVQGTRQNKTEESLSLSNFGVFEQGNYEFVFSINPGEQLSLQFNTNSNAYDSGLISRLGRHMLNIIDQVTRDEEIVIGKITLLTEAETRHILYEFNRNGSLPGDYSICQHLEKRAAEHPARTAVVFGDQWLTYGRLMELSYRLAFYIRRCGIENDRTVGILIERSLTMAVSILGIWKAGGAYIPLDPQEPLKRITGILQDSCTSVLITRQEHVKPGLKDAYQGKIVQVPLDIDSMAQPAAAGMNAGPDMTGLAYVIYTSGSTGAPKGAMIEHRGMMNHIEAKIHQLKITENSVIAQNASHTFDISVWQFYAALVRGGRTVIYPQHLILEPQRFLRQVIKNRVTILEIVPSYLAMLLDGPDTIIGKEHSGAVLEYLLVTGEEIQPSLVKRWRERYPAVKMVNAYGPTEASDDISHYLIDSAPGNESASIPIGKPLQNLKIYIVNPWNQLCPVGVRGEIWVSGIGVGRGYLNDPGKTRSAFIKDPYAEKTGIKLYKTGDLGCWREDGVIEFFGRKDHQVKIRGFRIEPGEIEQCLMRHPGVKAAVVTAVKDGSGDPRLCAYIVPPHPGETNEDLTQDLKDYLSGILPPYMVPSHFLELEKIPLTANGKVDRHELPEPPGRTAPPAPPSTPLERKLAHLWGEVLSLPSDSIGIDDDFFRMGGHSLKAMLLLFKIHQQLEIKLPMAELFHTRTIHHLARFIENTAPQTFIPLEAVEKKEYYPLSPAQKRLYILQEMNPTATAYNLPQVYELPQVEANPEATLADIFRQLIGRHESLRTCFPVVDGEPVQRVLDEDDVEFQLEESREKVVRPFNLARAPLLRAGFFPANSEKRLLLVDIHHIVTDGISNNVLLRDFIALARSKTPSPLRVQYKDFSIWQHNLSEKDNLKRQEAYWLKEFTGKLPVLDLPTDYPRPATRDFTGFMEFFQLDNHDSDWVKTLALEHGVTLYMILLAFLNLLLAKISGEEDIIVGSPFAGRGHIHLADVMGMFVSTLAMRNFPVGEKPFEEFLRELKQRTLMAFENQDYPFEELVEKVALHRDVSRNPLFDVLFMCETMENTDEKILEKYSETSSTSSKFDMTWQVVDSAGVLSFSVVYCQALFKKETIRRFIACFKQIIASVSAGGTGIKLEMVEIIPLAEKNRILFAFNNTSVDYPADNTLDRLFSQQVELKPHHTAMVSPILSLSNKMSSPAVFTYRELDRVTGQRAHLLRQKGVGPGTFAAIMLERSPEMIIAILAVLKAGGAYLPVDPSFPAERVKYILEDSQPRIVITGESPVLHGKAGSEHVSSHAVEPGFKSHGSMDPAYLIYTSGSTGRPKGVVICHYSVVNRLTWMQKEYPIGPGDVILQKTTFTFDVSVWELSWWYLDGAAVCLAPPGSEKDPAAIVDLIERHRVNIIHFVPSMLGAFLEYVTAGGMGEKLTGLRHVFASGERLDADRLELFHRVFAPWHDRKKLPQLINLYGPTEAAVDVSYYNCSAGKKTDPVPIGNPIDNTVLYILDKKMKLQPLGITGELCIGGVQVGLGYLNQPELTAEKFIRDLLNKEKKVPGKKSHKRIYKTGDLARWKEDGNILFLGRIDHQVKVRGYRIELGEIETRLRECPGIKDAVAAVKKDGGGDCICAYLVSTGGKQEPSAGEVEHYLATVLPDYMVPSYFIHLEALPLTTGGKIHHQALPMPGEKAGTGMVEYIPPGTPLEKTLTEQWQEVLGIEKVGINHNFFQLGGHSLTAIKLAARLNKKNIGITVNEIFLYPTIRNLARSICLNRGPSVPPPQPQPEAKQSFAGFHDVGEVPSLETIWQQLQGQWDHWNEQILGNRKIREFKMTAMQRQQLGKPGRCREIPLVFQHCREPRFLQESLQEMIHNQGLLRSVFREQAGEYYWVKFSAPDGLCLPVADLTGHPPLMRDRLAGEIVSRLLNRNHGQNSLLYRVVCFKRDTEEYVLVMVIDHMIYDGMSRDIITRDITTAYLLKAAGRSPVRVRTGSYAEYVKQISRGPLGLEPGELIEKFELNAFSAARRKVERILRERGSGRVRRFTLEVPFPPGIGEDGAWEFAFSIFVSFLSRALGISEIPIEIISYGRRFGEKAFFDTVGDFTDLVPVLVRTGQENLLLMANRIGERIRWASEYNINFMTLVSEPSLQEKWHEVVRLLASTATGAPNNLMLFNLVGKASEDRIRRFKPGVEILGPETERSSIHAEIYYGPASLYIYFTTSLNIEDFTLPAIPESGPILK